MWLLWSAAFCAREWSDCLSTEQNWCSLLNGCSSRVLWRSCRWSSFHSLVSHYSSGTWRCSSTDCWIGLRWRCASTDCWTWSSLKMCEHWLIEWFVWRFHRALTVGLQSSLKMCEHWLLVFTALVFVEDVRALTVGLVFVEDVRALTVGLVFVEDVRALTVGLVFVEDVRALTVGLVFVEDVRALTVGLVFVEDVRAPTVGPWCVAVLPETFCLFGSLAYSAIFRFPPTGWAYCWKYFVSGTHCSINLSRALSSDNQWVHTCFRIFHIAHDLNLLKLLVPLARFL